MFARPENRADTLASTAGETATGGRFIAAIDAASAASAFSGSGGGNGKPNPADIFINALSRAEADAEALAEADAAALAEAEAAARAFAAAFSFACNAATPPGTARLTPNCDFKLAITPASMPIALSCGIIAGTPPGKPGRFALSELIIA